MVAHNLVGTVLSSFPYFITHRRQNSAVTQSMDSKVREAEFNSQKCQSLTV